jgi:hypothetical protein
MKEGWLLRLHATEKCLGAGTDLEFLINFPDMGANGINADK